MLNDIEPKDYQKKTPNVANAVLELPEFQESSSSEDEQHHETTEGGGTSVNAAKATRLGVNKTNINKKVNFVEKPHVIEKSKTKASAGASKQDTPSAAEPNEQQPAAKKDENMPPRARKILPSLLDQAEKENDDEEVENRLNDKTDTQTTLSTTAYACSSSSSRRTLIPLDIQQHDAEGEDERPTKRRRGHRSTSWDGFIRKGARLKNLMEEALEQMTLYSSAAAVGDDQVPASHFNKRARDQEEGMETSETSNEPRQALTVQEHTIALAREKTAECMILQKKLQDAKAEAAALTATNDALRESSASTSARLERTLEALRLAGTNAANARADADAAEATASSLATQLENLRNVVQHTQRTSQLLTKEHEEIAKAARVVETKLVQKETELARSQSKQRQMSKERNELKAQAERSAHEAKTLQRQLEEQEQELHKQMQQAEEYKALEQARRDRSTRMEQELYEARSMLSTASATAAETENTTAVLQETIRALQTENESMHERIADIQKDAQKENERLNGSLTKSEKQVQALKIDAAAHEQEKQRLVLERRESEKQATALKTKVAALEKKLRDASSFVPLDEDDLSKNSSSEPSSLSAGARTKPAVTFSIPPLQATTPKHGKKKNATTNKVTPAAATSSKTCCLCLNPASGFMKSCQCGASDCELRAHASCLAKQQASSNKSVGSSVSYPGTPAARVPVVLCGSKNAA